MGSRMPQPHLHSKPPVLYSSKVSKIIFTTPDSLSHLESVIPQKLRRVCCSSFNNPICSILLFVAVRYHRVIHVQDARAYRVGQTRGPEASKKNDRQK